MPMMRIFPPFLSVKGLSSLRMLISNRRHDTIAMIIIVINAAANIKYSVLIRKLSGIVSGTAFASEPESALPKPYIKPILLLVNYFIISPPNTNHVSLLWLQYNIQIYVCQYVFNDKH